MLSIAILTYKWADPWLFPLSLSAFTSLKMG
jgi:hypothetical protein